LPNIIDHRGLVDEALMCTGAPLMRAGALFQRRTADLKTVPWLHLPARLNTIAEARERLRVWAEAEWNTLNNTPGRGHFEGSEFVPEIRENPFAKQGADA